MPPFAKKMRTAQHGRQQSAPITVTNSTRREFLSALGSAVAALVGTGLALPAITHVAGGQQRALPGITHVAGGQQRTLPAITHGDEAPQHALMTVYKDPGCGCCKEWVKLMTKAGFAITAHDTADMNPVKSSMGVPANLQSCHTAIAGNYVFEGHVPADVILKFLAEKPVARGLAVPGMPAGSPGMEGPTKDKYNVILFERSGKTRVYASR